MTIQQRVSERIGQRVKFKPSLKLGHRGEGVVIAVSRENGRDMITGEKVEENQIRWDDGSPFSWEMREDLFHVKNKVGDTFVSSGGMGTRPMETPGVNAVKESRDVADRTARSTLLALQLFGVLPETRPKRKLTRERELTLEIRKRVAYGYPTKGAVGSMRLDPRKLKLAAVAATGEPILVRKGKLNHSVALDSNGLSGLPQRIQKAKGLAQMARTNYWLKKHFGRK